MRRLSVLLGSLAVVALAACGKGKPSTAAVPSGLVATPEALDSMWSTAMAFYRAKKWGKAGTALERFQLELPPGDKRQIVARFFLAETRVGEHSNLQAVREFRRVSDEFPSDSLAPLALLRAGDAYAALWRRAELDPTYGQSASATYQELISRYPASPAAKTATDRIAGLDDRFALKTYQAGMFYVKFKAYDSAILYLKDVVATWPRSSSAPKALEQLVKVYRILGYTEDVAETCTYIRKQFPDNASLVASCPAVAPAAEPPKAP